MNALDILSILQKVIVITPERKNVGSVDRVISLAAGSALAYTGIKNYKKGGSTLLPAAGYLIWRSISGYCAVYNSLGFDTTEGTKSFEFIKAIRVQKSRSEIYNYWRHFENLPKIMTHISKVEKISEDKYHWEAEFNKQRFTWDAILTEDIPFRKISWKSVDSADVKNEGSVEFTDLSNGGTEIKVTIIYQPEKTTLGAMIARFFDPVFQKKVKNDLREFKKMMEANTPVKELKNP